MTTKAEELGAANLGDLEGFARDMSSEAHQLREVNRYKRRYKRERVVFISQSDISSVVRRLFTRWPLRVITMYNIMTQATGRHRAFTVVDAPTLN